MRRIATVTHIALTGVGLSLAVGDAQAQQISWEVQEPFRFLSGASGWPSSYVGDALYSVPRSFARAANRFPTYLFYKRDAEKYDPGYVVPDQWIVRVHVTDASGLDCSDFRVNDIHLAGCDGGNVRIANASATGQPPRGSASVQVAFRVRNPEQYPAAPPAALSQVIDVDDKLILALGDSFASGDGNPDVQTNADYPEHALNQGEWRSNQVAFWTNSRCHRSLLSWPYLSGQLYSQDHPHSSVTVINVACSGAQIKQWKPERPDTYLTAREGTTQLEMALAYVCAREIKARTPEDLVLLPDDPASIDKCDALRRKPDAVVLSIGGNDIGFSGILQAFVTDQFQAVGDDFRWNDHGHWRSAGEDIENRIQPGISRLVYHLADALKIKPADVLLIGYLDPTHRSQASFCDDTGTRSFSAVFRSDVLKWLPARLTPLRELTTNKTAMAYERVLVPLTRALKHAATNEGIRFLPMMAVDNELDVPFTPGYCVDTRGPLGAQFLLLSESFAFQGDARGAMHPNKAGHASYAQRVAAQLAKMLE